MSNEFVGHPLLEDSPESKIDINQIFDKNKALISIFPGSRVSEITILMPIILEFIELMNMNYDDFIYIFHINKQHTNLVQSFLKSKKINNCEIISDEKIKSHTLKKSVFAVAKSGQSHLKFVNLKFFCYLIQMNFINFLIVKMLVKIKFANIVNIVQRGYS